jgi:hypothetical protein
MFTMLAKLWLLGSSIDFDEYFFKESRLCVPSSSIRELLVREAYGRVDGAFWC